MNDDTTAGVLPASFFPKFDGKLKVPAFSEVNPKPRKIDPNKKLGRPKKNAAPTIPPVNPVGEWAPADVGIKFDTDKPRMDLIDGTAMQELAKVLTFGARKYAPHNWRKGIQVSRLIAAALRHIAAYNAGEDVDPETGLSHMAHAMCCCMFVLGTDPALGMDDRYAKLLEQEGITQ